MPWLVETAFIHTIQMQERRGMLKAWNILLVMVAFFLSIFGTFEVRSGILASVHALALSAIRPYFLTFLALVIAGGLALFFWRLPYLRGVGGRAVSTLVGLATLVAFGIRGPRAVLGFGLCRFVLGTNLREFGRGTLARRHATGENYLAAFSSLIRRNNRRYGGYVVHL